MTQPWVLDPHDIGRMMVGFKNSPGAEPISLAELEREYCLVMQQPYPIAEMEFARSWMLFRVRYHPSFHFFAQETVSTNSSSAIPY